MLYIQQNEWSILDETGGVAITFDSMLDMNATEEAEAPENPVEQGAFATYNKIIKPSTFTVTLGIQGDKTQQDAILRKLREYKEGTDVVKLSTPSRFYENLTLTQFDYQRRAEGGAELLVVALQFKEVREVESRVTTTALPRRKVKNPTSADREDGGQAQTRPYKSFAKQVEDGVGGII